MYINSPAVLRFFIPWYIMYSILIGLGISGILALINRIIGKSKIKSLIHLLVILSIISLLIYTSYSERIFRPYHEHHQMGVDIVNACKSIPENSYLIFQDDVYNSMYFYCYPYLENKIINQFPLQDDMIPKIKTMKHRLFIAYKEKLREDYDKNFNEFSKNHETELYYESVNVNLYEII